MSEDNAEIYLVHPRKGGFSNDVEIQTEDHQTLYLVRSKLLAPMGRVYVFTDKSRNEVLRTRQDHTVVFPRHTMLENGKDAGKVGQLGVIPRNYFIQLNDEPRAEIHIGGFKSIYSLNAGDTMLAEVAQVRSDWLIVIQEEKDRLLYLFGLAILFREDTLTG